MIFSMISELVVVSVNVYDNNRERRTKGRSCRSPLKRQDSVGCELAEVQDVRLPWIHKSEGADFHSLKISPRKNHVVVPS